MFAGLALSQLHLAGQEALTRTGRHCAAYRLERKIQKEKNVKKQEKMLIKIKIALPSAYLPVGDQIYSRQ